MRIISDLDGYAPGWEGCVLTMGDFDGIHKGHRKLIERTIIRAKKENLPSVLLTYDPSPKKVLQKLKFDSNIYTRDEKMAILQKYPLHTVVFLPFDQKMARLSAKDFLRKILLQKLKCKRIIIGYDHHFGRNRHGHYTYLKLASRRYGFQIEKIKPVRLLKQAASSSLIRRLLRKGKIKAVNELLAAPYMIRGTVVIGKQRGRLLGIPTANLHIPADKLIPKEGVYFCLVKFGHESHKSVVNIGYNPTFENVNLSLEAHLLNFDCDIYGEKLTLFFLRRIRDEKKFLNIDELKKQIKKDIAGVRRDSAFYESKT